MDIWGTNSTDKIFPVQLLLTAVDLKTGWTQNFPPMDHSLQPNASTALVLAFPCPHPPTQEASDKVAPSCTVIIQAKLVAKADPSRVLSRMSDWPQPYKFWTPPDVKLDIRVSGETISIQADVPVKGVILSVEEGLESVQWSDNAVGLTGSGLRLGGAIANGSSPDRPYAQRRADHHCAWTQWSQGQGCLHGSRSTSLSVGHEAWSMY